VTPYTGTGDGGLLFAVGTVSGSAYRALDTDRRFVLAGRAKFGSLVGEETDDVPANKRFYAGGGGSIRGYEFQSVGPLDANNDPLGGRSLIELNAELRVRITEQIGLVPFVDGGMVFDSVYPDFEEDLRWAAGLGVRYFSAIGPLRLDIAIPLNKREVDDSFQFYISLGQAF
jgi:translocation and assembly module TamA